MEPDSDDELVQEIQSVLAATEPHAKDSAAAHFQTLAPARMYRWREQSCLHEIHMHELLAIHCITYFTIKF